MPTSFLRTKINICGMALVRNSTNESRLCDLKNKLETTHHLNPTSKFLHLWRFLYFNLVSALDSFLSNRRIPRLVMNSLNHRSSSFVRQMGFVSEHCVLLV